MVPREKAARVVLLFFGVICGLLIGEVVVRYLKISPRIFDYKIFEPMVFVEDPKVCYKMSPFGSCEGGRLNAEGFKGRDYPVEKGDSTVRIIMLGDSITKGSGVSLGETFSDQLEAMLNQEARSAGSSLRFEVMNFGVGGYNIVSEIGVLKAYGLKYSPDIVIQNYFWNDNQEYSYNYWWFMENSGLSASEKNLIYRYYLDSRKFRIERLLLRSHLFRLAWMGINRIKPAPKKAVPSSGAAVDKEDIILEQLAELKRLAAARNFHALVCMHPVLDYDRNPPHPNYARTRNITKGLGLACIDLLGYYKNASKDPRVFLQRSDDPVHPNSFGHALAAKSILSELQKNRFVEFR